MAKSLSNVIRTASGSIPLQVSNGGTGVSTLSGLIKANGTNAFVAATAGTDYMAAVAPNTSGYILTSNGTTWVSQALPVNASTLENNYILSLMGAI